MTTLRHPLSRLLLLLCCLLALPQAWSSEEEKPAAPQAFYVEFDDPLVVNFGKPGPHLKYIKATISFRVSSDQGAFLVKYHAAQIRNDLVLLFSRQTDEDMKTVEGREKLRQEALKTAQDVLNNEEGEAYITNLLMPSFIVQD
ncbi:flagellar basal body-associated FliL family protein [Pokkaliibacter sp. MBI-7]|uniref:flagellar basal body-associated FliL family protein n=1 Tax=Pokkaliibacter sp. MBI-7 TaxID=3040600 RepID=UPI002447EBA7|nr:flagellar basal body-associated FliL family protein [Pokkaliibacter sp. MBI-7]MDH2434045.1 flagellar basal body-associated FliL family protein [Pokkaliibacter sp. MBI-7]